MTEQIKLCCDCKYYRKNWFSHLLGDTNYDNCSHPLVSGDVVNGKNFLSCKTSRNYRCGYEGKFWEEKKK